MNSQYCSMLPKFNDFMSNRLFCKEIVNSECLIKDDCQDLDESLYDLNELEEAFSDHILMGKRLQSTLYRGNIEDLNDDTNHPPMALTDLALKLFSKAVPNYGLDQLDMDYVSSFSEATSISPCAMILALIYLERLRIKNNDYLESVSPSALFVVTMLVASKFLFENEDDIVTNQMWSETLNIDVKELNELEQKFLSAIDWRLYVESSEFFQYLSNVEKIIALKQSSLRGWLSYSDIFSILQDYAVRKILLSCIRTIIKVFAVSAFSYAVTVSSMYISAFALQCRYNEYHLASSKDICLKTDTQMALPILTTVDHEAEFVDSVLDDTSMVFSDLSLSNRNDYDHANNDFNYLHLSRNLETVSLNDKKHFTTYNDFSSFLKEESKYNLYIYNNSFLTNLRDHSVYKLHLLPQSFKNSCIFVSVQ